MSVNKVHVEASPERCFEILKDARSFSYWVVGADQVRAVDPNWPRPGSAFDHSVGVKPFLIHDHTKVERVEENRLLCLRAKARPVGTAYVIVQLEPARDGTDVTLIERPADKVTRALFFGPMQFLLYQRNAKAIRRFKELAEGTMPVPGGQLHDRETERRSRERQS